MNQQLSKNFALKEFLVSKVAKERKIDNSNPPLEVIENLSSLSQKLLQPLRDLYGKPIVINSGYRSKALNSAVGGVASSQHLKGEAADLGCENPKELLETLKKSNLTFDQAILYPTFLHLSLKKIGNRAMVIIKSIVVIFLLSSCTKPIYLEGKREYIEKVIMKDSTIYIELPAEKSAITAPDSSFLEVTTAVSKAVIDSGGNLFHTLIQKQQQLKKEIQYQEKIIKIHDSIPYPQIIKETKIVKEIPSFYRWCVVALASVATWFVARLILPLFLKKVD